MKKFYKNESGQVMALFALLITVLIGATALCVDYGLVAREARILQNAADSAVLAATPLMLNHTKDEVKEEAVEYAAKNGVDRTKVEVLINDSGSLPTTGLDAAPKRNRYVCVTVESIVPLHFAKIFGINETEVSRKASASIEGVTGVRGCVPFSVDIDEFQDILDEGGDYMTLKEGGGSGTNGAYGALRLGGNGASVYRLNIINGYSGLLSVGDTVPTENGNMSGPTMQGLSERCGECTHYASSGGCTPEHYVSDCPRIVLIPLVRYIDIHSVTVEGFAPFLLDPDVGSGSESVVHGTYLPNLVVNGTLDSTKSTSDYGPYTVKLIDIG